MIHAKFVLELQRVIANQSRQIEELREGTCRFHCATRKEAFMAGFDAGMDQGVHWNDRHEAFDAFLQMKGMK